MRPRSSRRRGIALADFLAGSMILAGTMSAAFTLTRAKVDALANGERRARALALCETHMDRVRTAGLPALPQGGADADGFRQVATFPLTPPLQNGQGRVEARALRLDGGDDHGQLEVRVVVRWAMGPGAPVEKVTLSTIAAVQTGGAR